MPTEDGIGTVVNKKAPDFNLIDQNNAGFNLYCALKVAPLMLVFYPKDFSPVCTKQLCDYGNAMEKFIEHGIQIFGISPNNPASHKRFAQEYKIPFLLLSDMNNAISKMYGVTSFLLLGKTSRANLIINTKGTILYRYVERLPIFHRKSNELLSILDEFKDLKLI